MLDRIRDRLGMARPVDDRFSLPPVDVIWQGHKTYLRNFAEYARLLRRDSDKLLQYLSKEFAVPAQRIGGMAMFIGKRAPDDFKRLLDLYVKNHVECPTCTSHDTRTVREDRFQFLVCEACGARSALKGRYA